MMTFEQIKPFVDELSITDIQRLSAYLQELSPANTLKTGAMNLEALLTGVDEIRSGVSEEELDEMIDLMNEEYIEEADDDIWGK